MQFEVGHLYHIYNQGNNKQTIFFNRDNYLLFLKKLNEYVLSEANIVAWCLMPNHFHLMVEVKENLNTRKTLNQAIAVLLRSYTRAINKQQNWTGSLFRPKTKAECISKDDGRNLLYYNTEFGTIINNSFSEDQYPQVCFDYIHENPVKAGIVTRAEDWEFSSFLDYKGFRSGKLVKKSVAERYKLIR